MLKRLIGMYFPTNACNLNCSYCYVHKNDNKIHKLKHGLEDIKEAFSIERLGGECFINISSNGEPLILEEIIDIIKSLAEMGHYIMVLSNGTLSNRFDSIIRFPKKIQDKIFIKFSFHYKELVGKNLLNEFFANIQKIKDSNCSFTVELMASDDLLDEADFIKEISMQKLGALPHVSIPRDERKFTLGVLSDYSFRNFISKWKSKGFNSKFFDFKADTYGKPVNWFCYAGVRSISVNMDTGIIRQCYHTPDIQNAYDLSKSIRWLPVGTNCCEAHCYVSHIFMPLGIVDAPCGVETPSYFDMRNMCGEDGIDWVKPLMKKAFIDGIEQKQLSECEKKRYNEENTTFNWTWRKNNKSEIYNNILHKWLINKIEEKNISSYLNINNYKNIAIYGFAEIGQTLYYELMNAGINVKYIIDRDAINLKNEYPTLNIVEPDYIGYDVDVVIVTAVLDYYKIKGFCERKLSNTDVVSIEDVIFTY